MHCIHRRQIPQKQERNEFPAAAGLAFLDSAAGFCD